MSPRNWGSYDPTPANLRFQEACERALAHIDDSEPLELEPIVTLAQRAHEYGNDALAHREYYGGPQPEDDYAVHTANSYGYYRGVRDALLFAADPSKPLEDNQFLLSGLIEGREVQHVWSIRAD